MRKTLGKRFVKTTGAIFATVIVVGGVGGVVTGGGLIQNIAYAEDTDATGADAAGTDATDTNDVQDNNDVADDSSTNTGDTKGENNQSDSGAAKADDQNNNQVDDKDDANDANQSDDISNDGNQNSDGSTPDGDHATDNSTNDSDDQENIDDSTSDDEEKSYDMYVKIVDQKGNPLEGASIDIEIGQEGIKKKVTGSETAPISSNYFLLSNLQVPKGFLLPKYESYTLFNSYAYNIADYYGVDGLGLPHKGIPLGAGGVDKEDVPTSFYDDHIALEKNPDGSYTTSIKIDAAYYNDIGGNISGEEDPKIDDEYVKGSGETVTLIFKRVINDNDTFSHFVWLEYDGTVDGKGGGSMQPKLNTDYFIKPGSVKVELTAKYLETLGVGTHMFNAHFDDSTIPVQAKVKVLDTKESNRVTPVAGAVSSGGNVSNHLTPSVSTTKAAPTGDGNNVTIWSSIAAVTGAILTGALIRRRKNDDA